MPEDLMRYDQLAQNALRGVVREALRRVEKSGLPGEHHFYIAFNTKFPGVDIGERMAQRYPREMTIVLQHQYENLVVKEDRFEVELSFDNILEKLVIPFNAVKGITSFSKMLSNDNSTSKRSSFTRRFSYWC